MPYTETGGVTVVALLEAEMGFVENLRRLRAGKDWSQDRAAREVGVPVRTYLNWELGKSEPRMTAVVKLARAFGVTADELLAGVGEEEPAPEAPRKPPTKPAWWKGKKK